MLYGLEDTGLSPESMTAAQVFRSTGATCEELVLLSLADEASAKTAAEALTLYITYQIQTNADYRPAELPKLEQHVLEQRGNTVLLMVANHPQAAHELLAP